MFSCRQIGDAYVLREDVRRTCSGALYNSYRNAAVFWAVFYVAGVPLTFVAALLAYEVPQLAAQCADDARLRMLVQLAHDREVPQPAADLHRLTTRNITAAHADALFEAFCESREDEAPAPAPPRRPSMSRKASRRQALLAAAQRATTPAPSETKSVSAASGAALSRERKVALLVEYASMNLMTPLTSWGAARGDTRLDAASVAVGALYSDVFADRWYWHLVETLNKLLLTGVLGLISPGTMGQVVAGLALTFCMLLLYQTAMPYTDKLLRRIFYAATIQLFLFFLFALMARRRSPPRRALERARGRGLARREPSGSCRTLTFAPWCAPRRAAQGEPAHHGRRQRLLRPSWAR